MEFLTTVTQPLFYIISAVLVFGILIFIHELGHFIMARRTGVTVYEFSLGMGPAIFKKKKNGIIYALRAFPIGGYVSMAGEDEESDDPNSFEKKSVWKRFSVILAGAAMNIILGFIILIIVSAFQPRYATTTIGKFSDDAVSSQKLQVGDKIIGVNDTKVNSFMDLATAIGEAGIEPPTVEVVRNNENITLDAVPFPVTEYSGVKMFVNDFQVYGVDRSFTGVFKNAWDTFSSLSKSIYSFFGKLVVGRGDVGQVSGPVGTTKIIGDAAKSGPESLFLLVAFISINLGIVNLLPLPALDGGRLVFLAIEGIFRKRVNPKIEAYVNYGGLIALLGLMVLITLKDVWSFVK